MTRLAPRCFPLHPLVLRWRCSTSSPLSSPETSPRRSRVTAAASREAAACHGQRTAAAEAWTEPGELCLALRHRAATWVLSPSGGAGWEGAHSWGCRGRSVRMAGGRKPPTRTSAPCWSASVPCLMLLQCTGTLPCGSRRCVLGASTALSCSAAACICTSFVDPVCPSQQPPPMPDSRLMMRSCICEKAIGSILHAPMTSARHRGSPSHAAASCVPPSTAGDAQ